MRFSDRFGQKIGFFSTCRSILLRARRAAARDCVFGEPFDRAVGPAAVVGRFDLDDEAVILGADHGVVPRRSAVGRDRDKVLSLIGQVVEPIVRFSPPIVNPSWSHLSVRAKMMKAILSCCADSRRTQRTDSPFPHSVRRFRDRQCVSRNRTSRRFAFRSCGRPDRGRFAVRADSSNLAVRGRTLRAN